MSLPHPSSPLLFLGLVLVLVLVLVLAESPLSRKSRCCNSPALGGGRERGVGGIVANQKENN